MRFHSLLLIAWIVPQTTVASTSSQASEAFATKQNSATKNLKRPESIYSPFIFASSLIQNANPWLNKDPLWGSLHRAQRAIPAKVADSEEILGGQQVDSAQISIEDSDAGLVEPFGDGVVDSEVSDSGVAEDMATENAGAQSMVASEESDALAVATSHDVRTDLKYAGQYIASAPQLPVLEPTLESIVPSSYISQVREEEIIPVPVPVPQEMISGPAPVPEEIIPVPVPVPEELLPPPPPPPMYPPGLPPSGPPNGPPPPFPAGPGPLPLTPGPAPAPFGPAPLPYGIPPPASPPFNGLPPPGAPQAGLPPIQPLNAPPAPISSPLGPLPGAPIGVPMNAPPPGLLNPPFGGFPGIPPSPGPGFGGLTGAPMGVPPGASGYPGVPLGVPTNGFLGAPVGGLPGAPIGLPPGATGYPGLPGASMGGPFVPPIGAPYGGLPGTSMSGFPGSGFGGGFGPYNDMQSAAMLPFIMAATQGNNNNNNNNALISLLPLLASSKGGFDMETLPLMVAALSGGGDLTTMLPLLMTAMRDDDKDDEEYITMMPLVPPQYADDMGYEIVDSPIFHPAPFVKQAVKVDVPLSKHSVSRGKHSKHHDVPMPAPFLPFLDVTVPQAQYNVPAIQAETPVIQTGVPFVQTGVPFAQPEPPLPQPGFPFPPPGVIQAEPPFGQPAFPFPPPGVIQAEPAFAQPGFPFVQSGAPLLQAEAPFVQQAVQFVPSGVEVVQTVEGPGYGGVQPTLAGPEFGAPPMQSVVAVNTYDDASEKPLFKLPEIKLPKFSDVFGGLFKLPELKLPEVKLPEYKVSEVKVPTIKTEVAIIDEGGETIEQPVKVEKHHKTKYMWAPPPIRQYRVRLWQPGVLNVAPPLIRPNIPVFTAAAPPPEMAETNPGPTEPTIQEAAPAGPETAAPPHDDIFMEEAAPPAGPETAAPPHDDIFMNEAAAPAEASPQSPASFEGDPDEAAAPAEADGEEPALVNEGGDEEAAAPAGEASPPAEANLQDADSPVPISPDAEPSSPETEGEESGASVSDESEPALQDAGEEVTDGDGDGEDVDFGELRRRLQVDPEAPKRSMIGGGWVQMLLGGTPPPARPQTDSLLNGFGLLGSPQPQASFLEVVPPAVKPASAVLEAPPMHPSSDAEAVLEGQSHVVRAVEDHKIKFEELSKEVIALKEDQKKLVNVLEQLMTTLAEQKVETPPAQPEPVAKPEPTLEGHRAPPTPAQRYESPPPEPRAYTSEDYLHDYLMSLAQAGYDVSEFM